eukprot:UN14454
MSNVRRNEKRARWGLGQSYFYISTNQLLCFILDGRGGPGEGMGGNGGSEMAGMREGET